MPDTTLVIMAAGIGSRFGAGIKQLEKFGANGELIIDFSIYDALAAGFNKIVFIIRRSIEREFKETIGDRIAAVAPVEYVYQELDDLPAPYSAPADRAKPWGTGQAILVCRDVVKEPFAVINADDFYGREAFIKAHDFLVGSRVAPEDKLDVCMVSFILGNTLSRHGGVTRGVCSLDAEGKLTGVTETYEIIDRDSDAYSTPPKGSGEALDKSLPVSMNFWCFRPEVFDVLDAEFKGYLEEYLSVGSQEFILPNFVDKLLKRGEAEVTVLSSADTWFGVTYQDDVPFVRESIRALIDEGKYPAKLYG
ncbi:MAG: nucleotidyltransferase [Oscillospiraceae bacterium]|nr:nucleotidyltransferase [Oscillospiraceae bacterium]